MRRGSRVFGSTGDCMSLLKFGFKITRLTLRKEDYSKDVFV